MACDECGSKRGHLGGCSHQRKARQSRDKRQETGDANSTAKYFGSHQRMIDSLPAKGGKKGWTNVDCPRCGGSGKKGFNAKGSKDCTMCSGRGKIQVPPD